MMSGAWLEANTPASLAMARPRRSVGPGGSHFFQEIRFGHSGDHEIEPEQVRVDPRREESYVVALDRGPHFGLQRIAVENLLPVGAVLVAEHRGALKIEEELAQPIVSHGRYFAMSAALLFRPPIPGERHEPHRQGAPRRRAAVGLFFHEQEMLDVRWCAHRDHHSSAGLELVDQRLRYRRGRRCDDDGVEGRGVGPAAVAVADAYLDVAVPELAENLPGAESEGLDDLDRVDLRHQLGEHCRLVTRARSDLEHGIGGLGI